MATAMTAHVGGHRFQTPDLPRARRPAHRLEQMQEQMQQEQMQQKQEQMQALLQRLNRHRTPRQALQRAPR